jgi:uncharacterized protein (TIGR03083 family)
MTLQTAEDARRVLDRSRAEYKRLLGYLEHLPAAGWTEQSACAEWQVYRVVSHLGSQAQIHAIRLEAGLRGDRPMTDEQRNEVWDHFNSLKPDEMLPAFRRTNDEYFKVADSLTDEELGRSIPWNRPEPAPVVNAVVGRLNEQVLHAWDIEWARNRQATLAPEPLPDLLEHNISPARLSGLVKPDRAPELDGKIIGFLIRPPSVAAHLQVDSAGAKGAIGRAETPDVTLHLPTEAFIRLLWGRYDLDAGLKSGQVKIDHPELAEELHRLFPGR